MEDTYTTLDDNWIREFENTDKLYKDFYKDNIYYINLRVIYINRENEIDKIKQESFLMSKPNTVSREEVLSILKRNSTDNDKKYSLLSILQYNIVLEPDHVKDYLHDGIEQEYLSIIKNIDQIIFEKSISMFHDINDLILIFYEKSNEIKNPNSTTKRIYIRPLTKAYDNHNHNHKRHHITKTIKKRYKD